MSHSIRRRTFLTTSAAVLAAAATAQGAGAAAADHARAPRITTAFALTGDRVYPEGIALDPRNGDVYVGSYADGSVQRAVPGARSAEVFLPAGADGRATANGLRVDAAGRLWVTDSTSGVAVYDVRDRALLARFDLPDDAPRFVNDLVVTPDGTAYLTDSIRAVVYRVTPADLASARGGRAPLTPRYDLKGLLTPRPVDGFSLNGIATDGRRLYVVDMPVGELFRIDLRSGTVRRTALHGGDLTHGDGLELVGRTLWVAHNRTDTVSRWRLTPDGGAAHRERLLTDPALGIPTTLVRDRGRLLVVRSQFDKGGPMGPGTPATPFTVADVRGI
ncbi:MULTISPECIES: SMP-30/gluconolactonase/LRE family protein [Streptomyces]|uniref:Superoxide dismutase n=2 Tax=Streptomyces TaxID=1883 RepID=A0ABU4KI23_9ACTN|nr:superoxide dismutase [Streptomyces roseolus]MDX2297418.1 superoxide dismutase [Streptomyces roseolus]